MDCTERPLLKPWYRLSTESGRSVLRYAGSVLEFDGAAAERLLPHLLPLLDGTRSVDEVVAELGEPVRPAVEHALALLQAHDLLTDAFGASPSAELLAATTGRTVPDAEFQVLGSGARADSLACLLGAKTRLDWADAPPRTGFVVVAPSGDEVHLVAEWNERAVAAPVEWMQVLPYDGRFAAIGPVFVPGETACHECFLLRRDATIAASRDRTRGRYLASPATDAVIAGLAAHVALTHLTVGGDAGALLALELTPDVRCTRHVVYRVPRCSVCSKVVGRAPLAPWSDVAA